MASLLSSSAAIAAGAVLPPVGHPTSRSGAGLLSFAPPGDSKVSGLVPVISRGSGLVALAVPEGATRGWGLLPASTNNSARGSGLVALAVPEGATGGWGLLPATIPNSSHGNGVLALAVPERAAGLFRANATRTSSGSGVVALALLAPANATDGSRGIISLVALAVPGTAMDLLPSNTMEASRGSISLDALAVREGATGGSGFHQANTTTGSGFHHGNTTTGARVDGLVALALPVGSTGGWSLLPDNTTTGSRVDGLVALALPVGSTGGWSLLPDNTTETSRGDVLALALPAGGWGARHGSGSSRTNETSQGNGVVALAVPEGATGGQGFLKANTTYSSRGDALAVAVPARWWGLLPANAARSSRWEGLVARALPEEGANRWGGCGPLPEGAPAEDVKRFYSQEFAKSVEKIGKINTYALFGHPDILEVAAEAAERCIKVVDRVDPVVIAEFAGYPTHQGIESITSHSVRLVKDCRFVIAECRDGYVRERTLSHALYNFKMPAAGFIHDMDLGGLPDPPKPFISITVTPSPSEAEKVEYFKRLADEFNELTLVVQSRVEEWIDSGKSVGWYEWSVISSTDDD